MRLRMFGAVCLLLGMAFLSAGCGDGDGKVKVYKTTGKVVRTDGSAGNLTVIFHPADGGKSQTPVFPSGNVQADGTFTVTTYIHHDGAYPGEYIVVLGEVIDANPKPAKPLAKYLSPKTSPLRAKVEAKELNELPPFDISK